MLMRWTVLIVIPYVVVPAVNVAISLPSFAIWAATEHGLSRQLSDARFAFGTLVAVALSVAVFFGGQWMCLRTARKRRAELHAYLADPSRG